MRVAVFSACLMMAALFAAAASAAPPPDRATIATIERLVKLPAGARPLRSYDRWYLYRTVSGRRMVEGLYLGTEYEDMRERQARNDPEFWKAASQQRPGRVHPVSNAWEMPAGIDDGGCDEVHVLYDVAAGRVTRVACNGLR
jgi:hypothetical protein